MPSLRCLISALTQAGGGDLLLRFAISVQSCCGEGGTLQADVAVCGEHSPCSGQAACCFGGLSVGAACLFPPQRVARAARGLAPFPLARCAFSLRSERPGQPEVWRPLHGHTAPFPSVASACRRSGLRKSLDRNRGLFAGWEGVASLGLSLPLSPPPASYLQRGWASSSLEFLSSFVLRTTCGVFQPVNFSLALPQFKKSPSDCSQGLLAGPHPKQCRQLLSVPPPLAGGGCGRLGVLFCWELLLGT